VSSKFYDKFSVCVKKEKKKKKRQKREKSKNKHILKQQLSSQ